MRALARIVFAGLAVAALARCGGVRPTASPAPSTERPTPSPVPGATQGPVRVVQVTAKDIAFRPQELGVTAGAPFVIHFQNSDPIGIPHNVDIRRVDSTELQLRDPIDGGQSTDYAFDPLAVGDYVFICRIHPIPAMSGTLLVR
jgi:plastocyanin